MRVILKNFGKQELTADVALNELQCTCGRGGG